jgi:hypothetical protein
MLDLTLTSLHDLDTSTGDLSLVAGAERVRQQLLVKLKLWRGEWFLDTDFGTPYLQSILGKQLTLSGAIVALRRSILEVDSVRQILEFGYRFDNSTRQLTVAFSADTPYGIIEVQA